VIKSHHRLLPNNDVSIHSLLLPDAILSHLSFMYHVAFGSIWSQDILKIEVLKLAFLCCFLAVTDMGFFFGLLSGWNFFWSFVELIQKNVDEAAEKLKAKGIKVLGVVCHVSNAQQRKNLIETTVQVRKSASFLIVCK